MKRFAFVLIILSACINPKKKFDLSDTKDGWVTKQTYQIKIEARPPQNMVLFARRKNKARRIALELAQSRLITKLVGLDVLKRCEAEAKAERPASHMCKNSRNMVDLVNDGFIHDLTYDDDQACLLTYHVRHPNLKFLYDTIQDQALSGLRSNARRTNEMKNKVTKESIKKERKKDNIDDLFRDDIDQVDPKPKSEVEQKN